MGESIFISFLSFSTEKEEKGVKNLLKSAGFCYEATIPNETLRNGKFQSIDLYSINKSNFNDIYLLC